MSKQKMNVNLRNARQAFVAGERSMVKLHESLIGLLVDWSHSNATDWAEKFKDLDAFIHYARDKNVTELQLNSIESWFQNVVKFRIVKSNGNFATKKDVEYNQEWLQACKDTPWYKHGRDMQEVKQATVDFANVARMLVKAEHEDVSSVNWSQWPSEVRSEATKYRSSAGYTRWAEDYDKKKAEGKVQEAA